MFFKYLCHFVWLIAVVQTASVTFKKEKSKLPSFFKICKRNDPRLNACARNSLYGLKDRMQYGIPELYIPPLEPLLIPQIKMDQDTGAVYIHSTYRNIHIYGLSNFTIKSLSIDGNKMKFVSTLQFPNITMNADYEIDGKIMMMPLSGNGECTANFTDVELQTVLLGERLKKDGRVYLRIKNISLNYNVDKVKVDLKNLFNGDDSMGDRMNKFLNENWDSLSEELRPLLEKSLTEVVKSSTDKLLKAYSYDDLLPE